MKESMITDRPLVLTPPALCFLQMRSRATLFFFFFLHLIPAHTFLILILQVASYKTHIKCQLTLITGRCGVLRSTRVLHTMLNRPGTRSNRLGPDPDPADHLKYRPEPEYRPGSAPGSSGLGSSVKTSTAEHQCWGPGEMMCCCPFWPLDFCLSGSPGSSCTKTCSVPKFGASPPVWQALWC